MNGRFLQLERPVFLTQGWLDGLRSFGNEETTELHAVSGAEDRKED
jgi:hypothetical protein